MNCYHAAVLRDRSSVMKEKLAIVFIGIILAVSVVLTGNYGLRDIDKRCYESAAKLQGNIDELGFKDFKLTNYPMAFCDGKRDYVITPSGDSYSIQKRKPVLDTFVATAYEIEGHYEVIIPTKEMMAGLMDVGMAVTGDMESGYSENTQVTTIWHEAFHCWQLSNFENNISGLIEGHSFGEEGFGEELVVKYCDDNSEVTALYKEGAGLLKKAAEQEDEKEIRSLILQYKDIQEKRNALLDEAVLKLEDYYTSVEGSACYVEAMACRYLDEKRFEDYYMENISIYAKGSSKYYNSGMTQCMILDKLDSTWKTGYDFSKPLVQVIYEELGL